jgi:hypothetical protein
MSSVADDSLISTPEAAALLGVPEDYFTKLAEAINLEAAVPGTKERPRQWHRSDIQALQDGPEGEEVRATVWHDERVEQEVRSLAKHYPDWTDAIRAAADALFQFNRSIKHAHCTPFRRIELYGLKNKFMKRLYERGCCTAVELHAAADADEDGEGEVREYVAFTYQVEGQRFSWHAPRKAISWPFEFTDPEPRGAHLPAWKPGSGPKPVSLAPEEFVAAEALIRFVLAGAEAEEEAAAKLLRDQKREQMRVEGLARQAALKAKAEDGS